MNSQFVGSAYLWLSALAILILAQISQKPICINSQTIEKITMTDGSKVFRCSANKRVPYSQNFIQFSRVFDQKILPFESWIQSVWPGKGPKIFVSLSRDPVVTQLQGKYLIIWEQNLKTTHQLEFELAKNYLKSLNPGFFSENELALSSLADFTVRVWSENQGSSYGGLPTYIAHQWWVAYSGLESRDKFLLLKKVPSLLKGAVAQTFKDPETKTYDQLVQLTLLFSNTDKFFSRLNFRSTFEENSLTASFDYLVLTSPARSDLINSLSKIQEDNPYLNLGIWDGTSLYHVGSKSQISVNSFSKLKVDHLVWETCDDLEIKTLLDVSAEVRKLLVVKNCSEQNHLDYSQYVLKGMAGFAATHPQVSFVQLNMPSLNMRREVLELQHKIFEMMAQQALNKEGKSGFLSLFGLEQLNWDRDLHIFIPKAQIDAVESFRVLKTN
jgi:hypothetical protein